MNTKTIRLSMNETEIIKLIELIDFDKTRNNELNKYQEFDKIRRKLKIALIKLGSDING